MLAEIKKMDHFYLAHFERQLHHSVEKVWSMLTNNEMLSKWFSELSVEELREGGIIKFDMQDGTFEELEITELKMFSVLQYTWGEDCVRFELYPVSEGCRLILKEKINKMTDHTPKDLAGWHVCLEVIKALLDGRAFHSRESEWKKWHDKYIQAIEEVNEN
ncbi:SRPBCC family protein [Cytobacillus dafuensis]|uniref:SRPBCC family protein n=1 Tax=Cytobacillus dafuensis TaxID=1742359 RepID=A0A5B8Z6J1_CYTDA|nr:SRPBCC family protein [Cytobacillus dafuensis]QED47783.1 SRPBCC family protein [Cytobacillus dafuensis]